jgi:hypothetical protein
LKQHQRINLVLEMKCHLREAKCEGYVLFRLIIQSVQGGKVNILGGHSIGHSKKKSLCGHVSYSERFPIFGAQYFEFGA